MTNPLPTNNPIRVFDPEPGLFTILVDRADGSTVVADRFPYAEDDWGDRTRALLAARSAAKALRRKGAR